MKYLLDTHILLWALFSDEKLSSTAYEIINSPKNEIFYSAASVWEVSIKNKKSPSKMPITGKDLIKYCHKAQISPLVITDQHAAATASLERAPHQPRHNDPFDKLLIAQAKAEKLRLLTHDELLRGYNEPCVILV